MKNLHIPEKHIEEIKNFYGLCTLAIERRLGGLQARNLLTHADGRSFVIKKYNGLTEDHVLYIEKYSKTLQLNGIPAVVPKAGHDRSRHLWVQESCYALLPFCLGNVKHEPTLSDAELIRSGQMLARMHGIDPAILNRYVPPPPCSDRETPETLLCQMQQMPEQNRQTHLVITLLIEKKNFLEHFSQFEHFGEERLCHGGYHNENILFSSNEEISCIIDFEHSRPGNPMIDIAKFIDLACCTSGFSNENVRKSSVFLSGYRKNRHLDQQNFLGGMVDRYVSTCLDFYFEKRIRDDDFPTLVPYIERDIGKLRAIRNGLSELTHRIFLGSEHLMNA